MLTLSSWLRRITPFGVLLGVGILLTGILSQPVMAAKQSHLDETIVAVAKRRALLEAFQECMSNNDHSSGLIGNNIKSKASLDDVRKGHWNQPGTAPFVGAILDPGDGKLGCADEVVPLVIKEFGYRDGLDLLCDLSQIGARGCADNGPNTTINLTEVLIKDRSKADARHLFDKVKKHKDANVSYAKPELDYVMAYSAFANTSFGCLSGGSSNTSKHDVWIVDSAGVATRESYQFNPGLHVKMFSHYAKRGGSGSMTCGDIQKLMTSTSTAYAQSLQSSADERIRPIIQQITAVLEPACGARQQSAGLEERCAQTDAKIKRCEAQLRSAVAAGGKLSDNKELITCLELNTGTSHVDIRNKLDTISLAQSSTPGEAEEEGVVSCQLEGGLGWIICPLMTLIASVNDTAYNNIIRFLSIPAQAANLDSGTYRAWNEFRNIANVVFVILFLFVIISHITGAGMSNYGLKRLMPRLVAGAILLNVSYFITQLAVDASNVVGASLNAMLESLAKAASTGGAVGPSTTYSNITAAVLVLPAGIAALILLLGSVMGSVMLAAVVTLIILIARQSIVILLVALSPLAFAAWLLPNTEPLFKKWLSILKGLLLVYPIFSLLFGFGTLASTVIAESAVGNSADIDRFLQIAALGAQLIPIGLTPFVLRSALNATGQLGAKLSSLGAQANARVKTKGLNDSRLGDILRHRRLRSAQRQAAARIGRGRMVRAGEWIATKGKGRGGKLEAITAKTGDSLRFLGTRLSSLDKTRAGQALGLGKGAAYAAGKAQALFDEEKKVSDILLSGKTTDEILMAAGEGKMIDAKGKERSISESLRAAAIDRINSTGGFSHRRQLLVKIAGDDTLTASQKQAAIQGMYAKGDGNIYGVGFGDAVLKGEITNETSLEDFAFKNLEEGNLSPEHIVQGAGSTKWLVDVIDRKTGATGSAPLTPASRKTLSDFKAVASVARLREETSVNVTPAIDEALRKIGA